MFIRRYLALMLLLCFVVLGGCVTTSESMQQGVGESQESQEQVVDEFSSVTTELPELPEFQPLAPPAPVLNSDSQKKKSRRSLEEFNQKITLASIEASMNSRGTFKRGSYKIGPDDVLEISVFRVDDLNKTVRVTGDGYILLPLLGATNVLGKTTTQVQALLVKELGEKYLQDPHVTVFISEYRSHQVAVLGAVQSPDIFSIQQPRTILEMLSKAGGLTEDAGNKLRVQRNVVDQVSGERIVEYLIIDLDTLLEGQDPRLSFLLAAGDNIMVPRAGTVFVEGAVEKPGAYPLKGYTNVLKALAMAGGAKFEAKKGEIKVFRQTETGQNNVLQVNLKEIRINQTQDISLEDGDVVVVRDNVLKKGAAGLWTGVTRIFSVGKAL